MAYKIIPIFLFLLAILLGVLYALAMKYFLYWNLWWFDILMHFLGGLFVSLFVLWLYSVFTKKEINNYFILFLAVFSALLVGAFWEIFEVLTKMTFTYKANYLLDTVCDIMMDIAGGLGAYLIIKNKFICPKN